MLRLLRGARAALPRAAPAGLARRLLSYPSHNVVRLPALSPTMEIGTVVKWNVEEGEAFGAGDSIAEVETDKATLDFTLPDEGVVAKHLQPAGTAVPVGAPIMVVVENTSDIGAFRDFEAPGAPSAAALEEAKAKVEAAAREAAAREAARPAREAARRAHEAARREEAARKAARPPRVLFVHGLESGPHGLKARYLAERFEHSLCVAMPNSATARSSVEDYEECLELQREALAVFKPDVIVGSSFGGALCLDLISRGFWIGPAVLLCPAHRNIMHRILRDPSREFPFRRGSDPHIRLPLLHLRRTFPERRLYPGGSTSGDHGHPEGGPYVVVHGKRDTVVDIADSRALLAKAQTACASLVEVDDGHGLKTLCGVPTDDPDAAPLPPPLLLDRLVWGLWDAANWRERGARRPSAGSPFYFRTYSIGPEGESSLGALKDGHLY